MASTSLPDAIRALMPAFVADLRSTLDDDLVGVYLYGSAVAGGFDPATSDFDVAVVTARPTDEIAFDRLRAIVRRLAEREPGWADRLDIVFVGQPTLSGFGSGGPLVSISHDEPLERHVDADDWLQTWYLVRAADTAILGPPIDDLIPQIGLEEFVDAVSRDAHRIVGRALEEHVSDALLAYTLLTLARVLRVRENGDVVPKDDAGRWLGRRRPADAKVLETAIAVRHGGRPSKSWRDVVRPMLSELSRFEP